MQYGKYYKVPHNKLEPVLTELGKMGFQWRELIGGSPMEKHFKNAISHTFWSLTQYPILEIEVYKHYKFVVLKSNHTHNEDKPIYEYEQLLTDLELKHLI